MAKMTVLDMVQDILSDMNSDEVNSISDSLESTQVARIIESTYFEMMANKNWPHLKQLNTLNSSGDSAKPTHMKMPDDIKELHVVQYNKIKDGETRQRWSDIEYVTPDAFLRKMSDLNSDNSIVESVTDHSGVQLLVKNNRAPEYYTSFNDEWLVFDSYDNTVDTTLQTAKTRCTMTMSPTFTLEDSHIPDLPVEGFPALLAEAKSTCFARIKQMPDGKSEQQAKRQRSWLSRKGYQSGSAMEFPDYGRN